MTYEDLKAKLDEVDRLDEEGDHERAHILEDAVLADFVKWAAKRLLFSEVGHQVRLCAQALDAHLDRPRPPGPPRWCSR